MTPVITATGLSKHYGRTAALDEVALSVDGGQIVGVLGRNGAGKTTLVETIAGLRDPDSGTVRVLGLDPAHDRARLAQVLGVQLQAAVAHPMLKVRELVRLYRSFYPDGHDPDVLIDRVGLTEARRTRFEVLSGGQQQRLSIALALVGKPRAVILDELSTGLDPEARRGMWEIVADMRADGVAVILVSHSMDEVARLCDRVVLLDHGRVVVRGTVDDLVTKAGVDNLEDAFLALTTTTPPTTATSGRTDV